ncbi:G1/S-specific cyclin-D2-like [Oppia nitens]|uniref:G1/S-specific cyclin-D2-like n=1 Tax=Oppia nitens TaxID=1686743 RepID=UPI0023DC2B98|nr:G1/S-specific cyclin-D2-like [Oppia nitens]
MSLNCDDSQVMIPEASDSNSFGITYTALDNNILGDDRILKQLLQIEDNYVPKGVLESYKCIQSEVEPNMRKIVSNWMLEVCEETNCEEVVFPVAMNFLDRFLVSTDIRKSQLQLVGVVCLLIASKLRQCQTLEPHVLSYFTDYSVTVEEIIAWELLILRRIQWDVSSVVATDYLDHLFIRLPTIVSNNNNTDNTSSHNCYDSIIRRHSSTFIALCTTELQFSCLTPSLIAAASIATAVHGLESTNNNNNDKQNKTFETTVQSLSKILDIDSSRIRVCVDQIESLVATRAADYRH